MDFISIYQALISNYVDIVSSIKKYDLAQTHEPAVRGERVEYRPAIS